MGNGNTYYLYCTFKVRTTVTTKPVYELYSGNIHTHGHMCSTPRKNNKFSIIKEAAS